MPEVVTTAKPSIRSRLRKWARGLKEDIIVLYFAFRNPRTPLYAKIFAGIVVGYALSPIDLIPDFVPVLGYLDDIILLPFGIMLAVKLIPSDIMDECREAVKNNPPKVKPKMWAAAYCIGAIWIALFYGLFCWIR